MASCASPFVGPGPYGFKADERPRAPRAPSGPENQRRYAAALRGIGRKQILCHVQLDEFGNPTPEALAQCRRYGLQEPPKSKTEKVIPGGPEEGGPGAGIGPGGPMKFLPPPAPTFPEYITVQFDAFAGVGANVDRFSAQIGRPALLELVTYNLGNGDPASSHVMLFIRYGNDTTAGITDQDREIFIYPDPTANVGGIIAATGVEGQFHIPLNLPILTQPYIFHFRLANIGGAVPLHANMIATLRVIQPAEVSQFAAPILSVTRAISSFTHQPLPPSQLCYMPPGSNECIVGGKIGAAEIIAQKLRERPFGMSPAELQGLISTYGLPQSAYSLIVAKAAQPPNLNLLLANAK